MKPATLTLSLNMPLMIVPALFALGLSTAVHAGPVATQPSRAGGLSIAQGQDKLVAAGYRDIEKIGRKEGYCKVPAPARPATSGERS